MSVLQLGTTPVHIPVSYGVKRRVGYVGDQLYYSPDENVRAGESRKLKPGTTLGRSCWVVSSGSSQVVIENTDEPVETRAPGKPKAPKKAVEAKPPTPLVPEEKKPAAKIVRSKK